MHELACSMVWLTSRRAAVTCAIRVYYVAFPSHTGDFLSNAVYWTIWTVVECNIAIIAASVPAIIPLIKKANTVINGISGPSSSDTGNHAEEKAQDNRRDIEKGVYQSESAKNRVWHESSTRSHLLFQNAEQVSKTNMEATSISEEVEPENEDVAHMYATACLTISRHHPRRYSDTFLYTTRTSA